MGFDVAADDYWQFMGRYSEALAVEFTRLLDPRPGQRALDVGCGPGALTAVLVERLGVEAVAAVDPSASFVSAVRERLPGLDVHRAGASDLPWADASSDLTVAQLVVHFLPDPVAGLAELRRVTRPGGTVAACVWDFAQGLGPLAVFWDAVRELDPGARDESALPGGREGHLGELFTAAGLHAVEQGALTVRVGFAGAQPWWRPFTLGVGPAGAYVASLDGPARDRLEAACRERLPAGAFEVAATAWVATGRA